MMIYMALPFTNTLSDDDDGLYSANLTDDYVEHFNEVIPRRYKFKRREITRYKYPRLHFSTWSYSWVYTILDPKTFVLH